MNRTAAVDHARTKDRDGTGSRWARWRPRWGIAPRSRRGGAARRRPGGYRRGATPRGSLSRPTALADLWGRRTARAVRGATHGTRPRLGTISVAPPITRGASPRRDPRPVAPGSRPVDTPGGRSAARRRHVRRAVDVTVTGRDRASATGVRAITERGGRV